MSVDDFKWATQRKTSNKLSKNKQAKSKSSDTPAQKALDEQKEKSLADSKSLPPASDLNKAKDSFKFDMSMIDVKSLQSIDKLKSSYADLSVRYEGYGKTISNIDFEKQSKELNTLIDNISKIQIKTADDAKNAADQIKQLDEKRKELEKTYSDLKTIQTNFSKDYNEQKNMLKNINDNINKDVDSISSKLKLPVMSFDNLSKILVGTGLLKQADKILKYINLARKYMPEKSSKKATPEPRIKGMDMRFPLKGILPTLWIGNISVSGTSGGEGKDNENTISVKGFVKNITSDQKLIGKATTFELEGHNNKQFISIEGRFDRLKEIAQDKISFTMAGISAASLGIPETDYTPSFNKAIMRINADFIMTGGDFVTKQGLLISNIKYDDKGNRLLASLWQGINTISAQSQMTILADGKTTMNFSSDIDKQLNARFKSIIGDELNNTKQQIKAELMKYISGQNDILGADADKNASTVKQSLDPKLTQAQTEIEKAKSVANKKQEEIKKQTLTQASTAIGNLFKK
jgi:uncharacterized protein (TIGR03545 family)